MDRSREAYTQFQSSQNVTTQDFNNQLQSKCILLQRSKEENAQLCKERDHAILGDQAAEAKFQTTTQELVSERRRYNEHNQKLEEAEAALRNAKAQAIETNEKLGIAVQACHRLQLQQIDAAGLQNSLELSNNLLNEVKKHEEDLARRLRKATEDRARMDAAMQKQRTDLVKLRAKDEGRRKKS